MSIVGAARGALRGTLARKLIKATLGSSGVRFVGMVAAFLVGVQLARYLGPAEYGKYGLAMATIAFAKTFVTFGVPPMAMRETARVVVRGDWATLSALVRWSILTILVLGLVVSAVVFGVSYIRTGEILVSAFSFLIVILTALIALNAAIMRGLDRIVGSQSLDSILRPTLLSILLPILFYFDGELHAGTALGLFSISAGITVVCGFVWMFAVKPHPEGAPSKVARSRFWAAAAIPMGLTDILRSLQGQYPMLLLGWLFVPISDMGIFRVALSCMVIIGVPHSIVFVVTSPIAASLRETGDNRRLQMLATWSLLFTFLATATVAVNVYFFGAELLELVFGGVYVQAAGALSILALVCVFNATAGIAAPVLYAAGREGLVTLANSIMLVVGISISYALFWKYNTYGVAWGVAGGAGVRTILLIVMCRLTTTIEPSFGGVLLLIRRHYRIS